MSHDFENCRLFENVFLFTQFGVIKKQLLYIIILLLQYFPFFFSGFELHCSHSEIKRIAVYFDTNIFFKRAKTYRSNRHPNGSRQVPIRSFTAIERAYNIKFIIPRVVNYRFKFETH